MSAPNITEPQHLSMPETSRTRSDSLEESGSQQDRKRPRLSSSNDDQLSSEEALTDSSCPAPEVPPATVAAPHTSHSHPVASKPQHPSKMPTSPGGLPSKVTINTRTLQPHPAKSQLPSTPPKSPDIIDNSEQHAVGNNILPEVQSTEKMGYTQPDTISISSSPSRSPEIEVAELEDIDQNSAETRWTPITRFSSNLNRQEFPPPRHVHRTFPFAVSHSSSGSVHDLVPTMAKVFQQGGNTDGNVFLELRRWLSIFVQNARRLSASFLREESDFWSDFPDIVAGLLRRQVDPPQQARLQDLEDFFVDYARLTLLFVQFDLDRLHMASDAVLPETILDLACKPYISVLAWVLQYRDIPFYDVLRLSRNFNPANLVSSVVDRLANETTINMIDSLGLLAEQIASFLPKKTDWTHTFIQILTVIQHFPKSVPERKVFNADVEYLESPQIPKIMQKSLNFFAKVDSILQLAITKQFPWLTIDNSPDLVRIITSILQCIAAQDPNLGYEALRATGIDSMQIPADAPEDVFGYAWKFKTLRKYITTGRMELRVYGMDAMQSDLVHVWRCHIQYRTDPLEVPLVRYLVRFIQDTKLVEYIVGIESHPQLMSRSANVIGFLCVTSTYSEADSDTIWKTVSESQDPRTISEVLVVLKTILPMSQLSAMFYLCRKLMELPIQRFDTRTLDFVSELCHHIQQKSHQSPGHDDADDALPFKLFVRLLREASASTICPAEQKVMLQRFATERLVGLLRLSDIAEDEKRSLWELCVQDVAEMNDYATGSLQALNAWISSNPAHVTLRLVESFDFTRLFIQNLANTVQSDAAVNADATFVDIEFAARLEMLGSLIDNAPTSITERLREVLWTQVFTSQSLSLFARQNAWHMLCHVINQRRASRNPFMDSIVEDCLPRLEPKDFDHKIMEFVQLSVIYEIKFSGNIQPSDTGVITIPGIDRVWRIILQAPNGTVETAATDFVIKQYLDSSIVVSSKKSTEATHLSLVDRCVRQVIAAATRLRSFTDGTMSGEDEPMVIIASEAEIQAEEMRFDRSLLFLKQLLQGMKLRPRYSPPPSRAPELPHKAFQDRGDNILVQYQAFGGKQANVSMKKISIGDLNTGDELAHYLIDLTGFTQFTCISGGQKIDLFGNTAPLRDLRIGNGLLMVRKVPDTPEKHFDGRSRAPSPIDSKVIDHFNELYDLLNLDERLAKEVFSFLDLFPAQDRVREHIQAMEASSDELLPRDKPYKLLYCAKALRSCVEDKAFSSTPNPDFLRYSVHTIIATFTRPEAMEGGDSLKLRIAYVLTECLLLALRAPVPVEVSASYISDRDGYARYLLQMMVNAQESAGLEAERIEAHLLVREPFAALIEGSLHDEQLWTYLRNNSNFSHLLMKTLLEDTRVEVRKAIADVIFGLSGTTGTKVHYKPQDPRSARSRFPTSKIETSLTHWWNILVSLLPEVVNRPSQSQQLFEVCLAVFNCVGKSCTSAELSSYFESWSKIIVRYQHVEVIGRASDDYVVWGFTKLLSDCHQLLQLSNVDVPTSQLAKDLLSTFLFPSLSDPNSYGCQSKIPVLKDAVREDLYNLVLSLTKTQEDFDNIIEHLDDLVPRDVYFEPNVQNDRQALRSEIGYAGLRNLSNTCYLNSLFSQLFMNLQFRDFLFQTNVVEESSQRLVTELSKVFSYMQNSFGKFVDPSSAVESIRTYDNEQIDVSVQMDVDEFFNLLFDRLEAQILAPEARRAFRSLYGGQLVQQIKSRECEHISERLEPFSAIQCEIKGKIGLEDSLKAYVEGEVMQGDNKYSCTACNRHVDAVKRACLKDVPDHLIFNLKRFDFDITTMTRCKINDEFQFPSSIDMAPYTVDHLSQPEQPIDPDVFELVGVLVHSGTAESGHYYSYIRERPSSRPAKDAWVQFNDSEVNVFDPTRIHDCCFGGVDLSSPLQFSKGYSAYMLFYQRRASIKTFEATYTEHDLTSPVRLPLTLEREQHLALENELFLRSYCAQDRSHAQFVRHVLERMRFGEGNRCSIDHVTETKTLRVVLEYVQQISCRFKDLPEFEATMKTINNYAAQCNNCASIIADWLLLNTNFRDTVLRNPQVSVRRAFSLLLTETFRLLKFGTREQISNQAQNVERHRNYRHLFNKCVEQLEFQWEDISKFARAWNDYFDTLTRITKIGDKEALALLDAGFLEKVLEMIWVDGRNDPRKLKKKYAHFVSVREKGRVFNLSGLHELLAELLNHIDITLRVHPDGEREEQRRLYGLTPAELRLLQPSTSQQRSSQKLEWLRRVIINRSNTVAISSIVANMAQQPDYAYYASNTLILGLAADQVMEATSYLEPTIVFCSHCPFEQYVLRVVKEALDGIDSINSHYGKEHLDFVALLIKVENQNLGWNELRFRKLVLQHANCWAPALLLYPDNNVHCDVSSETVDLLQEILLEPLRNPDLPQIEQHALRVYAQSLVNGCIRHLKENYIPGRSDALSSLEAGQINAIDKVVTHIVENYAEIQTAEDEARVEDIRQTMTALRLRAQTVVETLSESWHDNDSLAISDSDNADLGEFGATTP